MPPGTPPGIEIIQALAEQALADIPEPLRRHVAGIGIAVEEMADDEALAELGLESAWDLTGLYQGTPRTRRSFDDVARPPDLITLYRQPILLEWIEEGEDLYRLVRSVMIHEVAHHFGFNDIDIERIEMMARPGIVPGAEER